MHLSTAVRLTLPILLFSLLARQVPAEDTPSPRSLEDAPANTWVKISAMKTGGRSQPLFVYAANIEKFLLATGMQTGGGVVPRHYDTEEFDLASGKWTNAYPPSVAAGRPESGPVGDEYAKARVKQGHNGPELFYQDGDFQRLGAGGQWLNTKAGYEFCYVPENGKVYLYMWNKTLCYDLKERTWEDLEAKPRASCRLWGSMCYDPVNKEIVHAGGDGGSADIGTWVYSIEKNEWRKLTFGSAQLKQLLARSKSIRWQAKQLLGGAVNRFAVTETAAESKNDLAAEAAALIAAANKLVGDIRAAGLKGSEKTAGDVAAGRLAKAISALEAAGPKLSEEIGPENIAAVRAVRVLFEQTVDALSTEPPGRARSQIAYDSVNEKIALFGGDGLDRVLSDTWLYDCKTRTWEQRFPDKCPAPRAGHVLQWLPKAKQIVLAGGYSRDWLAQDMWTYDVATNRWKPLLHIPLQADRSGRQFYSPNCPSGSSRGTQLGAVNEEDLLVCISGSSAGSLTVWACKVDPSSEPVTEPLLKTAASGSYTWNRIDPANWEKAASPDPEKMRQFYKEMPTNEWTALSFPKYAPGARNRWGTTAYDTDRHQFLLWGGGHATSKENDVAHFSVLGGHWTIGYHPDDPIELVYAVQPTPLSFHDRVHVPIHAYRAYCYDPTAGKMFYFNRAYNLASREWEPAALAGLEHRGPMGSQMTATPKGAVTYSVKGLFRFDAAAGKWQKLPWTGPEFGRMWCDGYALCYDSKRDCLWLGDDKMIMRYDMSTGKAEQVTVKKPAALGKWILWSEQVYLPDVDLILLMNRFKKPDGKLSNVAWSPAEKKYYWLDLKFVENGKPVDSARLNFQWSDALRYDPKLQLILLNNSSAQKVWVLKLDGKSISKEEIVP